MKKSLSTTAVLSAVCATALAGTLSAPADAAGRAPKPGAPAGVTKYGYGANAVGTKVVVENVELSTVRDALAQQRCTRVVGKDVRVGSLLSNAPGGLLAGIGNDLIEVTPSLSETHTYRKGRTHGVRAVSTIASIDIGGTIGTIKTPTLSIKGLESVADSFHDGNRFGATSSFGYKGLELKLTTLENLPPSLRKLLNQLPGVEEANEIIQVPVNTLVHTLSDLTGNYLNIPGLATIRLGRAQKMVNKHSASADTFALVVSVRNPIEDSPLTELQLGKAQSRITDSVPNGVFRSSMTALDLRLGDLLAFGSVRQRSMNCEGSYGKTITKRVARAAVLGGQLVNVTGVKYQWSGKQEGKSTTRGYTSTTIGRAAVPAIGLVITGIKSRVDLVGHGPGTKVTRKVTTSVGSITLNGQQISIPKAGASTRLPDNLGVIRAGLLRYSDYHGVEANALTLTLFENNSIIDLGRAGGRVWFK